MLPVKIISTFVFYDKGINGSYSSDESSNLCLWETSFFALTRKAPTRALIFLAVFILIPARRTASAEFMYCRWVKYSIFWPSVGGGAMTKYPAKYGSNSMPRAFVAFNPPPLGLYDCAQFALNNINKFAKGQAYAVLKFRSKTDKQSPQDVAPVRQRQQL